MRTIHDTIQRVRAEYLEMPGLRLKAEQVQRLCGIERTTCLLVLDSLVESRFLVLKQDGHYVRVTEGSSSPQSVKTASELTNLRQHRDPSSLCGS